MDGVKDPAWIRKMVQRGRDLLRIATDTEVCPDMWASSDRWIRELLRQARRGSSFSQEQVPELREAIENAFLFGYAVGVGVSVDLINKVAKDNSHDCTLS